jgi:hypothetical protein
MTTIQPHVPWLASRGNDVGPWPRYINAVMGVWLFMSAFLWKHEGLQGTNAWVVGALMFAAAMAAISVQGARFVNTLLAVWVFVSAVVFGAYSYTAFNNVVVAVVVFVFSLIPNAGRGSLRSGRST